MKFKKEVIFYSAWDKRSKDPAKSYGVHGVDIKFVLTGKKGVIQFLVYTNWHLPHVEKELDTCCSNKEFPHLFCHPIGADVGYHSPTPMYDCQTKVSEECEHLGGKPCYYDGSSLEGERVLKTLIAKGSKAVWEELEKWYRDRFDE